MQKIVPLSFVYSKYIHTYMYMTRLAKTVYDGTKWKIIMCRTDFTKT